MERMTRRGAARAAAWFVLLATCPLVSVTARLRPGWVFLAALCGTATVWAPSLVLLRTRPPFHRCPPRHARHLHAGADTDTRLKLADIQRRLDRHERAWTLAGILRRGEGQHERDLRLIQGGGDDDDPEDGDSWASLTSLPVGA